MISGFLQNRVDEAKELNFIAGLTKGFVEEEVVERVELLRQFLLRQLLPGGIMPRRAFKFVIFHTPYMGAEVSFCFTETEKSLNIFEVFLLVTTQM